MSNWLELVAMTGPCPACQGYDASLRSQGLIANPRTGKPLCLSCDKDGQTPLIPGLRKPVCGGADWVLVSGPEAMVAAMKWVWAHSWWLTIGPPEKPPSPQKLWWAKVCSMDWYDDVTGEGDSAEEALRAVVLAVAESLYGYRREPALGKEKMK